MNNQSGLDIGTIDRLKELGLTEYEAKIYLTLVARSPLAVNDISVSSEVPMSKIYGVLGKLESGGWIGVTPERPKKYRATDPRITIDHACSRAIEKLESSRSMLLKNLSELYDKRRSDAEAPEFQVIHGNANILNRMKEIIGSEAGVITVVLAFVNLRTAERVYELIKEMPAHKYVIIINDKAALRAYSGLLAKAPYFSTIETHEKWIESVLFVYTEKRGLYCSIDGDDFRMALDIMDTGFLELMKKLFEASHGQTFTDLGAHGSHADKLTAHKATVKGTLDKLMSAHKK